MPMYDKDGEVFFNSDAVFRANKASENGTMKKRLTPSRPGDYGARIRATMSRPVLQPNRLTQKAAFNFETSARNTEMGAFKEETNMRGRAKGAYNIVSGFQGRRMTLTAPESGAHVADVGQINRITAPPEGYVEISMGDLSGGGEQWQMVFDDFAKDIQQFSFVTTASQELRAFNKGKLTVELGNALFANNPQMMSAIIGISGELDRWLKDRHASLTGVSTGAQKSIGTIQTRLLNAINFTRTALGLAKLLPEWPSLPESPKLPSLPTTTQIETVVAAAPAAAPAAGSWFQRNKTMVIGIGVLAVLLGGYVWYQKQR